jgi:hypothetical protein
MGLLGSIALMPTVLDDVVLIVRHSDFYDEGHGKLFEHMCSFKAENTRLDPTLLVDRLKADGDYERIGGSAYLSKIINCVPNWAHARNYAEIIRDHRRRRDLQAAALRLLDPSQPLDLDEANGILRTCLEASAEQRIDIPLLSAADLSEGEFAVDYHVAGILAKYQPCIVAAPQKTLKTSICLDLAISLATGRPFLGKWQTNQCRVLMLSGESGVGALQSCARRICISKNCILSAIDGFTLSTWLPRFASEADLSQLRGIIGKVSPDVLFVDPAYLAMSGDDAGNLFSMGEVLRGISQLCQELRVTLVLVHHMRKPGRERGDQSSMPELTDIAWSGFAEFARQWVLMKRREPYEPGSGLHKLWFAVGGSAGHGGGWGLDVDEGSGDERIWSTTLSTLGEVAAESSSASAAASEGKRDFRKAAAEELRREQVLQALHQHGPMTKAAIGGKAKLNHTNTKLACEQLLELGEIEECGIQQGNGRDYPGFQVVLNRNGTTTTNHQDNRTCRGESIATGQGAL